VKNNLLLVDLTANNQGVLLIKATRVFVSTTCASIFVWSASRAQFSATSI
jgi:hypothetical protein